MGGFYQIQIGFYTVSILSSLSNVAMDDEKDYDTFMIVFVFRIECC